MALVRHPNLQRASGKYLAGATVTAITNRDTEAAADAYVDEAGSGPVSYPVTSGAEGELDIWVPVGSYESEFGDDSVDTPAVWEAISGEEIANMLTTEDIAGFPDYVFSPLTYGGDPTGVADSTTAIQAALDAAAAVDGTVHLGNGTAVWKYTSQLTMDSGVRITSSGGGGRSGVGSARLRYAGTGSTAAFMVSGKQRVEIDHVWFEYSDTGFTGPLVYLNGSTPDIINAHVHHCAFRSQSGLATLTADCGLRLHKVIISTVSECSFNGFANNCLQLGKPETGASYINEVTVRNCTFNDIANHDRGQICINSGDMEATVIDGCSFEGASPNNIVPIRGANFSDGDTHDNLIYQLTVRNCWSGDAGGAGPDNSFARGLNGLGDFGPVVFKDNFIDPSAGTSPAITAGDNGCAFVAVGNHVTQTPMFGTNGEVGSVYRFFAAYNRSPEGMFDTADPPTEYTDLSRSQSHLAGYVGIPNHADFDDMATWKTTDTLVARQPRSRFARLSHVRPDMRRLYARRRDGEQSRPAGRAGEQRRRGSDDRRDHAGAIREGQRRWRRVQRHGADRQADRHRREGRQRGARGLGDQARQPRPDHGRDIMTPLVVTPGPLTVSEIAHLDLSDGQTSLDLLGDPPWGLYLVEFTPPVVPRENTYALAPEGQRRIRSRPQNAVGNARVRIDRQEESSATFATDINALQMMVESAHKRKGTLTFEPPNLDEVTYDLESCQITEAPADGPRMSKRMQEFVIEFECRPYGRLATETLLTDEPLTGPIDGVEIPTINGHVDALAELTVTDSSSANADFVEFGIGQQGYDPDAELFVDVNDATAITDEPTVCASTGTLTHGGRQKIAAVLDTAEDDVWVRLAWRLAAGAFSYGRWIEVTPPDERELTLAVVEIGDASSWIAQIEAFQGDGTGTLNVGQIYIIPAEVCGRVRAAGDQHALDSSHSAVFTHEGATSHGARHPLDGDTLRIPASTASELASILVVRRRLNDIDAGEESDGRGADVTVDLEITPRVALY